MSKIRVLLLMDYDNLLVPDEHDLAQPAFNVSKYAKNDELILIQLFTIILTI